MVNIYFGMKIILWGIIFLIFLICFIKAVIDDWKMDNKIKILKKAGYERYLIDVSSYGNGAYYGWRNESKYISERDIKYMTKKEIKQFISSKNNNNEE